MAQQTQITLKTSQQKLSIDIFKGTQAFDALSHFYCQCLTTAPLSPNLLATPATLEITQAHQTHKLTGLITKLHCQTVRAKNYFVVTVELRPRLSLLTHFSGARVFQNLSVIDLATHLLHTIDYAKDQIHFNLEKTRAKLPFIYQRPNETHYQFLKNCLADHDLHFYCEQDQLYFFDNPNTPKLPYQPDEQLIHHFANYTYTQKIIKRPPLTAHAYTPPYYTSARIHSHTAYPNLDQQGRTSVHCDFACHGKSKTVDTCLPLTPIYPPPNAGFAMAHRPKSAVLLAFEHDRTTPPKILGALPKWHTSLNQSTTALLKTLSQHTYQCGTSNDPYALLLQNGARTQTLTFSKQTRLESKHGDVSFAAQQDLTLTAQHNAHEIVNKDRLESAKKHHHTKITGSVEAKFEKAYQVQTHTNHHWHAKSTATLSTQHTLNLKSQTQLTLTAGQHTHLTCPNTFKITTPKTLTFGNKHTQALTLTFPGGELLMKHNQITLRTTTLNAIGESSLTFKGKVQYNTA